MIKKAILLLTLIAGFIQSSQATHIVGGNFVVDQTGPNTYTITVRALRDCCFSCSALPNSLSVGVYVQGTNTLQQTLTVFQSTSPTQIPLGDECYTPTGVCVEEVIYTITGVTIPNNAAGYYLETELYARNNTIDNIQSPGATGMSYYAEIPDPALAGMNDSPDFGPYPTDGYLCVSYTKILNFGVTDPDGDSLVYSLITPLASNLAGNGTTPAPYPNITWQAPYSFANIVGGAPPMSINSVTGEVSATPSSLGTFVFAVRIEEYRNGVKIGEVRRDVQYHSLNCVFDDLPEINLPDTLDLVVGSTGCFDIVVIDADPTDTISILVSSPTTFADGATLGMPSVPYQTVPDTTYMFYYTNQTSGLPDSVELGIPVDTGGAYYGIGGIGLHYCWQTDCSDRVNNPFQLQVSAFSLGCSGDTNFVNQTVELYVVNEPPPAHEVFMPDTITVVATDAFCFDIVVLSTDPSDTLNVLVESSAFPEGATLGMPAVPVQVVPDTLYEFFYTNSSNQLDSVILSNPYTNNGAYVNTGGVGLQYCWQTSCNDLVIADFDVEVTLFKIGCFGDTTFLTHTSHIEVVPEPAPDHDFYLPDSISVVASTAFCFDIVLLSSDPQDTLNIVVTSPTLAEGATLGMPVPFQTTPDTLYQFFYNNNTDTVLLPRPTTNNGAYMGIGGIGLQYCWQTSCIDAINGPFDIDVSQFEIGCFGDTTFYTQSVTVNVYPGALPGQEIELPDSVSIVAQGDACFDFVILSQSPNDTINIQIFSSTLGEGATLTQPDPVSTNPTMYEYHYWNGGVIDSIILPAPTQTGLNTYTAVGGLGLRYCWHTECEHIGIPHEITIGAFRIGCLGDTTWTYGDAFVEVFPPEGEPGLVPNVFTPNGDQVNDEFKLGGVLNYCYDSVNVDIYNRWGQLVFHDTNAAFSWNGNNQKGEPAPDGVYFVVLNGIFGDRDVTSHYQLHLFRNK